MFCAFLAYELIGGWLAGWRELLATSSGLWFFDGWSLVVVFGNTVTCSFAEIRVQVPEQAFSAVDVPQQL